jgi:hypothetical protein
MSSFLLPCGCGQATIVTPAQAGQVVRCVCGAQLEVPTLRGLRQLAPATPSASKGKSRAWSNRHRVAFALILVSLVCLVGAVYIVPQVPPAIHVPTSAEIEAHFASSPPDQVMQVYQVLKSGLSATSPQFATNEQRRNLLWRIAAALAASCVVMVTAMGVLFFGRKSSR